MYYYGRPFPFYETGTLDLSQAHFTFYLNAIADFGFWFLVSAVALVSLFLFKSFITSMLGVDQKRKS